MTSWRVGLGRAAARALARAARWTALALIGAGAAVGLVGPAAAAPALGRAELAAEAWRLLQELSQLRAVPVPDGAVRIGIETREERRRFVLAELQRKVTPARVEAERRALVAWGLVPPAFDYASFVSELVVEQAAAYYDPRRKVMILANWLDREGQVEALRHELVHLLQDHQFDLDRFLTAEPGKGDEFLAKQALIEGEAVALALDVILKARGRDLAGADVGPMVRAITSSPTGPQLGRAPPFLRALLTFPYAHGLGFVREARRRQPWSAFSRLYADPPRSSSQILHPELYLDGRIDPVTVELPDLGPALGDGATRIVVDQAGEFGLTGVLREHLGEQAAATGWRGDSYAVWQPPDGGRDVLLARTLWETDAAAGAFATAYRQLLAKRRGLVPKPAVAGVTAWEVGGALFVVAEREREVLVLEQAPARQADRLARALGIPLGSGGPRPAP